MARRWTNMMAYEEEILRMRKESRTRKAIAVTLGLEESQIKEFIKRYNRRQQTKTSIPKRKGRPRKYPPTTAEGMTLRIKELEREVDLLRSFLHAAGRM